MSLPQCTAETPAPGVANNRWGFGTLSWNFGWDHPDATEHEILSSDYDDVRYRCPHCGMTYVSEGPDA